MRVALAAAPACCIGLLSVGSARRCCKKLFQPSAQRCRCARELTANRRVTLHGLSTHVAVTNPSRLGQATDCKEMYKPSDPTHGMQWPCVFTLSGSSIK